MGRFAVGLGFAAVAAAALFSPPARAQPGASALAGAWTLNRSLSEMPKEIGFNVNWFPTSGETRGGSTGSTGGSGGGRGGRRGSGGGGSPSPFAQRPESYDESRRVQLLTTEARNPPARLMIVDTPGAVTFTNELGQSRVLHPDVHDEPINAEGVSLIANTKRDGDKLVVDYYVAQGRDVRYTYSHAASPPQLIVEVQFLERGAGDKARRVYEPGGATETAAASPPAASAPAAPTPASPLPASGSKAADSFDSRPGAELMGLKAVGILVEDLSSQAVSCGLNHDAIETALSRRLSDGGFSVRRNSDEDTYVYVNVMTSVTNGTCVTRYDAFLYTHATANLSYRDRPVLVQVSLMHRGGMGSSAPTGHAAAVTRALEDYVGGFVTQIRDANK
jgi:hypothetical protein